MDYQVKLHDGTTFTLVGATIDFEELVTIMNSNQVNFIALGGGLIAKNLISSILPINNPNA